MIERPHLPASTQLVPAIEFRSVKNQSSEGGLSDEAGTGDQAAATHEAGSREFRPLNFNGRNSAIFEGEQDLQGSEEEGTAQASVLSRYDEVGLRTKPSKVRDYAAVQDMLGHTLDHNVLRGSCARYAAIRAEVLRMTRCGWVRPRELERLVGKITNWFLLHRPSLAVFNAVYAFCHSESREPAALVAIGAAGTRGCGRGVAARAVGSVTAGRRAAHPD